MLRSVTGGQISVPGPTFSAQALTAIAPQPVRVARLDEQTVDASFRQVATYADPVTVYGSFQAVNTNLITHYGLDMNKRYAVFYASKRFKEATRDTAPDAFDYDGRRWIAVTGVDWFAMDGWDSVLVVDSGPTPHERRRPLRRYREHP